MKSGFDFSPASFVPFRDKAAVERVRAIPRAKLTEHANPDFRIRILPDAEMEPLWIADMFERIRRSSEAGERFVMIAPNPWPSYDKVARLINEHRISCHHLHTFNMDEYANEHGDIAPESWRMSVMRAISPGGATIITPTTGSSRIQSYRIGSPGSTRVGCPVS